MSKIIGVTVGTSISPQTLRKRLNPVLSINNVKPDENGNVKVEMGSTEIDMDKIVQSVISALPVYNGEVVIE